MLEIRAYLDYFILISLVQLLQKLLWQGRVKGL